MDASKILNPFQTPLCSLAHEPNMAPWKYVVYAAVGLGVFILVILLNFDFLPKRMSKTEFLVSTISTGQSFPSTVLTTQAPPTAEKLVSGEMTLEKFNNTNWNCSNSTSAQPGENASYSYYMCYTPQDPSICVNDPLHCNHPDTSGKRLLVWPMYGEYKYLPKSMWILVLRHGGVVFLYHPCTEEDTIKRLRQLAKSCLKKYVISPSELLDPVNQSIAMVSWSCLYTAPGVNMTAGQKWIGEHALRGPATHVRVHGQYRRGLIESSHIVKDQDNQNIWCPLEEELHPDENSPPQNDPQENSNSEGKNTEDIIIISKTEHMGHRRQRIDRYNAAWALGSLLFLCVILGGVLLYTRLWKSRDYFWRMENYDSNVNLYLPKKKRTTFKFNWRAKSSKKSSAYSKLLGTIPEEDSDDI